MSSSEQIVIKNVKDRSGLNISFWVFCLNNVAIFLLEEGIYVHLKIVKSMKLRVV